MRTAEDVMWPILKRQPSYVEIDIPEVIECMKEYAKEAIEECAERAMTESEYEYGNVDGYGFNAVSKKSILSLIKELK